MITLHFLWLAFSSFDFRSLLFKNCEMTCRETLPQEICHKHLDSCTHNEFKHFVLDCWPCSVLHRKKIELLLLKYLMKLVYNFGVFGDNVQPTETWKGRSLFQQNFCLGQRSQVISQWKGAWASDLTLRAHVLLTSLAPFLRLCL